MHAVGPPTCHVKVLRRIQVELHWARLPWARLAIAVAAPAPTTTPATAPTTASASHPLLGKWFPEGGGLYLLLLWQGKCTGRRHENDFFAQETQDKAQLAQHFRKQVL